MSYNSSMNENDKILIIKYITSQATDEEVAVAKYLISSSQPHEEFYVQYYETWQKSLYYNIDVIDHEKAYSVFEASLMKEKAGFGSIFTLSRLAVAASLLLIGSLGIFFLMIRTDLRKHRNNLLLK